ncbi:unnamed protein product [Boreogadus saida]
MQPTERYASVVGSPARVRCPTSACASTWRVHAVPPPTDPADQGVEIAWPRCGGHTDAAAQRPGPEGPPVVPRQTAPPQRCPQVLLPTSFLG